MAAIDLSSLATYSWADIKKAAQLCMLSGLLGGQNYTINGKTLGRVTPDEARAIYTWADEMQAAGERRRQRRGQRAGAAQPDVVRRPSTKGWRSCRTR
jgi:hypothetical protein